MTARYTGQTKDRQSLNGKFLPIFRKMKSLELSQTQAGLVRSRARLISQGQFGKVGADGIFNPGVLARENCFEMLCRGEPNGKTWQGDWFGSRATPIWCRLSTDLAVEEYRVFDCTEYEGVRSEDWRLFEYRGRTFSNHNEYFMEEGVLRCRPCISEIDTLNGKVILRARLTPPFTPYTEEKNWSMFPQGETLLCIYSIKPYIVLRIDLERGARTETLICDNTVSFPWHDKGDQFISISTNIIEWDKSTYIVFLHDFIQPSATDMRNRVYFQYGMLIDKETLRPVSIVPDPLLIGGSETGRHSGVHYTTALVKKENRLYAFYGEGDSHTGVVIFDKGFLNDQFERSRLDQ